MVPTINTSSKFGASVQDLLSYRFENKREIWLNGEVNNGTATEIISGLAYLSEAGHDDITLFINSPGGSVSAGLAIYDAMQSCSCRVITVATGIAASMAAVLLCSGTPGCRFITPSSEVMIHQPLGMGIEGQASDIARAAGHIMTTKDRINSILSKNTGRTLDVIAADTDRDYYMNAQEAINYGLVDRLYGT